MRRQHLRPELNPGRARPRQDLQALRADRTGRVAGCRRLAVGHVGHSLVVDGRRMRPAADRIRAAVELAAGADLGIHGAVARVGRASGCGLGRGPGRTGSEAGHGSLGVAGMHLVVGAGMRPGGSQLSLEPAMRRGGAAILTCPWGGYGLCDEPYWSCGWPP